jgi:hypothetical protein
MFQAFLIPVAAVTALLVLKKGMDVVKDQRIRKQQCSPNNKWEIVQTQNRKLLKKVGDILKENNIMFWLNHGSLLGAIRNQSVIPYDNDVDLAIFRDDKDKVINLLRKHKLDLPCGICHFVGGTIFVFDKKELPCAEMGITCYHFDKEEKTVQAVWASEKSEGGKKWKYKQKFPLESLLPLGTARIDGHFYPVPANYDMWLRSWYGDNYMTPTKRYNSKANIWS